MRNLFAVGVATLLLLTGCGEKEAPYRPTTEREMYPGEWQESVAMDLSIALAHNKITGCGQFEHKKYYKGSEYLVACTRDGEKWTGYIVFPVIKKVVGPVGLEHPPLGMSQR